MSKLSPREQQVLDLLMAGERPKEIAAKLDLSPKTVSTYISMTAKKAGLTNEQLIVKEAYQRGFEAGMKHIASGMAEALIGKDEAAA